MINNQDRKQIRLMQHFLDAYFKNNILLSNLLIKLDHLARSTTPKAKWKATFFDHWITLESFNTESSVKRHIPLSYTLKVVNSSIHHIAQLINDLLASYEQVPDISVQNTAQELDAKWLLCPLCIDAWENASTNAMVICPKCNEALHNPRHAASQANSPS